MAASGSLTEMERLHIGFQMELCMIQLKHVSTPLGACKKPVSLSVYKLLVYKPSFRSNFNNYNDYYNDL